MIRESGIPYAIVRPCALTEEPAGAGLIFDQGDNITVCHQQLYSCVYDVVVETLSFRNMF